MDGAASTPRQAHPIEETPSGGKVHWTGSLFRCERSRWVHEMGVESPAWAMVISKAR